MIVGQAQEACELERVAQEEPTSPRRRRDVAIIGMSCLFPAAPNLDAYWRNILGKVDAVTDPPPEAWETELYFEPNSLESDRVYCKRGGYLGSLATFEPLSHGIPPVAVGGEPDQWLALQVARDALVDAGYVQLDEAVRRKTAVILGKGTYLNAGNAMAMQHGLVMNQTLEILKTLNPEYTEAELEALRRELKRELPPFNPETMPGLVPNVIVGRIANRLDLMGPTYTVDAACASSLVAVRQAMRDLVSGDCDLALAGGSQVWIPMPTLGIFCQLGALSPRQRLRPFDKAADGTLLGEGIGMLVLKRLHDAERDGDRIYAVIKGVGIASDGRGVSVMAPRVEGEELALRRAYEEAGVSPRTVGLIEAHGTGTPLGDLVEVQALARVFGPREGDLPRCALGSVKSMISHTIPAAGVAGIIKVALSLYHKVLPPTLHCDEPNPKLELEKTTFYINTETRPWIHGGTDPRRAGVNAFGFGGINAHVVLEEHRLAPAVAGQPEELGGAPRATGRNSAREDFYDHLPDWESEVCVLGAGSLSDLLGEARRLIQFLDSDLPPTGSVAETLPIEAQTIGLRDLAYTLSQDLMTSGSSSDFRLTLVATSMADLRAKLDRAARRLAAPGCRRICDVSGIYFAAEPLGRDGKLAFLFPGEGSQYPNMLADLCLHFPEVRECFDRIDRVFFGHSRGYLLSDYVFACPSFSEDERNRARDQLSEMDVAIEGVLTANQAMLTIMRGLGLRPDVIVGHSTGEFSAIRAAGILSLDPGGEERHLMLELSRNYKDVAHRIGVPRAMLLAVGAERERVEAIAREVGGEIFVAMDNCPHQTVLVGERQAAERALAVVRREGLMHEYLSFDRAYHTHLFAPYTDHLRQIFAKAPIQPPRIPIYSCTTNAPYPTDPKEIRELIVEHWVRPVEFRRTIEVLYSEGVRVFVEVGPRGNLSAFVEDILRGRPFSAIPANLQRRSGITQLNHVVAMLTAHGVNLDLMYLYRGRRLRLVDRASGKGAGTPKRSAYLLKLDTGFPTMRVSAEFARGLRAEATVSTPPHLHTLPQPSDAELAIDEQFARTAGAAPPHPILAPTPVRGPEAQEAAPAPLRPGREDGDGTVLGPRTSVASATASGWSGVSMIQDFLQTMERFLVVQERVMHGCLSSDTQRAIDPTPVDSARPATMLPPASGIARAPNGCGHVSTTPRDVPSGRVGGNGASPVPAVDPAPRVDLFPLLGSVVSWTPGEELVARRMFDPAEDLYLRDHTLGRAVSDVDPDLLALAVMPLTMSMEIMAEAAALLVPGRLVVGLRDLRAYRWIAFDDQPQELQVSARRPAGDLSRVIVQLRNLTEDHEGGAALASPAIEAVVVLADSYPQTSRDGPRPPRNGRPSRLRPDRLYSDTMFHGSSWQGVAAVEQVGDEGSVAALRVLPSDGLLRGDPNPRFVLDPVVLDAAGQVIGFWTAEQLATAKVIFPFRLQALEVYGPPRPAGTTATCVASIHLMGDQQVRSDIDVIADGGHPWYRLTGWQDKRFELPAGFHHLMQPARQELSTPWPEPVARLPEPYLFECRRVPASLRSDRGFWQRVWAQRVLNRAERVRFRRMARPEPQQLQWLAGRTAAKEAVRHLLRVRCGLDLPPADIAIDLDERGRPVAGGSWSSSVAAPPVVSIAHADGLAVAVAGLPPTSGAARVVGGLLMGVHIQSPWPRPHGCSEDALTSEELQLLRSLSSEMREEWLLRAWCAKEAVAKALGDGSGRGPRPIMLAGVDPERGLVFVRLADGLAEAHPDLAADPLVVFTALCDGLAVATTLCEYARATATDGMAVEGAYG
jgi:acyl transferase domain-containing protein/phosphopantetheinyl transferase